MSAPRRRSRLFTTSAFGALALAALWAAPAHAQLVQGATPAQSNGAGPAIDQSVPNTTTVTLGGSRTVIDWDRFDINSGDTANFVFANRQDIVLNRVGGAASTINGNLNGTIGSAGGATGGNIWIYNANGVVMGANARITTGGLLVTTAALDRATDSSAGGFLDGTSTSFNFAGAAGGTKIEVQAGAQVHASGSAIALIAPIVTTASGSSLTASGNGNVLVGSASAYKVSFRPVGTDDFDLISFEVASGADGAGTNGPNTLDLAGDITGNRVFVAAVSKSGLAANILSTGTITATTAATDETGAIVLSANHNIVNGAAVAAPVSGTGSGFATTFGGALIAPAVNVVASDGVLLRGDVTATGGTVDLRSDNADIRQFQGVITADTLTASAHTGINFNSFSANKVDKLGALSTVTGDLAYIGDEDGVELTGAISAPGKVTLGARGFMNSTTGSITAGSLEFSLGGGGSFKVNGDANIGYGQSQGAVTVEATGDITLANEFGMILGDALTLTAGNDIRQTTGFVSGGGSLIANAAGEIDLAGMNTVSSIAATSTNDAEIYLRAANSLAFSADTGGQVTVVANGQVTAGGAIRAGLLGITANGTIDLNQTTLNVGSYYALVSAGAGISITTNSTINIGGNVTAAPGAQVTLTSGAGSINQTSGTITGYQVHLDASGAIDQDGSARIVAGDWTEAHAGTNLLLRGANQFGDNNPYLTAGTGADLTARSVGNLVYTPYGNLGTLTLISDAGNIRQGNGINATTLIAHAATGVLLDGAGVGNNVTTVGGLSTASGDIVFTDGNGFDLAGDISAPGLVQLGTSGAITWSAGHLSASTLDVTAGLGAEIEATGNIKLGAISTYGSNFYLGSDSDIQVTGAVSSGGGNLTLYTSGGAITTNGGTITTGVGAGVAYVTAKGGITLVGAGFANIWATSTDGGDIDLSSGSDLGFASSTSGNVTVTSSGGNVTGNGDIIAGALGITAAGSIDVQDSSYSYIGRIRYLTAQGGYLAVNLHGDITLDGDVSAGNDPDLYSVSLISSTGSILQHSGTITGDAITLQSLSGITQASGATLHGGALSLTSNGNVTLDQANDFSSLANVSVLGNLTLRNKGSIELNASNNDSYGNELNLTSDTGDITAGNSIITLRLTASAANGSILLGGGGNQIFGLGTVVAGGDIDISTVINGFRLFGDINATNLTLLAQNGGITQNAGTKITAGTLNATANGNITLDQANAVTTVGGLNANRLTNGHNITFRNDGGFTLGGIVNATGGALTLTSDAGGIIQANSGSIRASQFTLNAAGYTDLASTSNNVATIGGITNLDWDTLYQDADGFDVAGNLTAGVGGVILRAGSNGAITQSAGIVSAGAFGAQGGSVTFTRANQFTKLLQTQVDTSATINTVGDLQIWQGLTGNTISLTSGGAITQGGSSYVYAYNTLNLSAVTGIDLPGVLYGGNNIIALGTVTNTTSGGIRIFTNNGGYGTTLAGNITATGQTVTIADQMGAINQTGGAITADTLNLSATGGISATSANAITNLGTLSAGGASAFTNAGTFNLTDAVTTGGNALTLTSQTGAITQTAGTITASAITAAAATGISLQNANDIGAITGLSSTSGDILYRALGDIIAPAIAATGTISLTSDTGSVSQTGALTANALVVIAEGGITLTNTGNNVAQIGNTTIGGWVARGGDITYVDADGFNLGWMINSGVHTLSLTAGGTGSIGQNAGGGYIVAHTFNATAGGSITLDNANGVTVLGNLTAGGTGDIVFRAGSSLYLEGNITAGTGGDVTLNNDVGAITQNSGRIIADRLTVNAVGNIVLDQAANDFDRLGASRSQNGAVTIRDTDAFDIGGQVQAAGALSLTSGGAITRSTGGLVVAGGLLNVSAGTSANLVAGGNIQLGTVTTTGNFAIDTDGDLTLTGLLNTNGGDATLRAAFGTIGRGINGTISANKVTATARDSITLDSTGNAVVWASSSNGGNINLTGDADIFFKIDTAGDLTVDAGGLAGNNDSVVARSVGINAVGSIYLNDQTVTIDVGSYRYLTSSAGSIDMENKGDVNLDGNVTANTAGQYIRLSSSQNSILQNSGTIDGSSVQLNAAGSILQDANAKVVTGDGGLSFSGTDVILAGANVFPWIGSGSYSVSRDLTLRTAGTLSLDWSSNQAGHARNFTLISDTGDVKIGYGLIDVDMLSASAVNGSITIQNGNTANSIRALGDLTAKNTAGTDIYIYTNTGLDLTGTISGGGVELRAEGAITESTGSIAASTLSIGAGGNLLIGGANNFGTLIDFGHGTNANVTIRNEGNLLLPTTGIPIGTLTLTSDTGSISQTSAITAATLIAQAATGIGFNSTSNNFTTLAGLATAAGDIRIRDTGSLAIEGDITAPGTVFLTAGTITTGTTTVGIVTTPHGKVDADTLSVVATNANIYAAGDIKLGDVGSNGAFTLIADNNIDLAGNLTVNLASLIATSGSITQSGGTVSGYSVLTGAAGSITLDKANNLSDFGGTARGGGTITFNNASSGAITLALNTTGDAVVTVAGNLQGIGIVADDLSVTAGHIDLTSTIDVNSFSRLVAAYGDVLVTNNGGFTVSGDVSASKMGVRSVNLYAVGGGISQTGGTISANDVTLRGSGDMVQSGTGRVDANVTILTGANLDLRGNNSFGAGTPSVISGSGNVQLNGDALNLQFYNPATDVTLTATGDITIGNMGLTANSLTANAGGALSATSSNNQIGTVHGLGGSSIAFTSTGFTLDGDVTATAGATLTATTGDIAQTAGTISAASAMLNAAAGSILQSGTGKILATSLIANSGGDLILGGANSFTGTGSSFAYGDGTNPADVTIRNLNSINFTGVSGQAIGTLSLTSDTGAITQTGAVPAGTFAARAATGITFDETNAINIVALLTNSGTGGISFKSSGTYYNISGDVTAAGQTVTLASSNGQIIQNNGTVNAGLLNIDSAGYVNLRGGVIDAIGTVQSNYTVLVGGITGNVALTDDIHAGLFSLSASGDITQTGGTITAHDVGLSAGGDITVLGDNDVAQVSLIGTGTGAIRFNTLGDLKIQHGTSNANGLLDIRAGGEITVDQFSTVTASQLALLAGGDIAIDPLADLHIGTVTGLVSDSGDIAFYNYAGFLLDGNLSAAGTVTVRTGMGDITQQSGIITADRLNIRTDNGSITLGEANEVDLLGDVYAGFGDFTFTNAGDLVADGSIRAPGMVTLTSGGTLRTTANGEIIGGGLIANAETGIALSRQLFGMVWGLSSTTGGIVFSNNGAFDIRGDIDAGTANVSLTANGGGITGQLAGTITAQTLTLDTDGDTDLSQANHVQSLGAVDTGTGYFHFGNAGDIVVNGIWTTGGDIALTSGGAISQTARITATQFTASAVNGITLDNASNAIDAVGGLSNSGSGSGGIVFSTTRDLALNGNVAAAGQNVSLNSTRSITQNSGAITATNFRANANLGLSLTSTTNNVANITGLTSAVSGGIAYTDADSFDITGDINALNGQTLSLAVVDAYAIVQQRDVLITAGTLNLSGGSGFVLGGNDSGMGNHVTGIGDIDAAALVYSQDGLNLTGTISSRNLVLWSEGAITQGGGQILYATDHLLTIEANSIALTSATNQLGDVDTLVARNGGAISIVSDGTTRFNRLEGGNVSLTVTNGSISSPGDNVDIGTLTAYADSGIDLGGTIGALGDLDIGGNATFRTAGDLDVFGTINAGRVSLSSGGAITQSAGTITASQLSASAASGLSLDRANLVGSIMGLSSTTGGIRYNSASGFALLGDVNSRAFDTELTSSGWISQGSGTSITAGKLTATATNFIDLTSSGNHIASLGALTATNWVTFHNSETIALTDNVAGSYVSLLSTGGAVRQDGGAITASNLDVSAATGIDLNAANNLGTIVALGSTTGDIRLRNVGDIVLPIVSVGGNLTLTSDTGAIRQGTGTAVAVNGTATLNAVTGVDLGELNAINNLGQVTNSGSGGITVRNLTDLFLTGNIQALGQQVSLTSTTGKVMQPSGSLTAGNLIVHASETIALDEANHIDTSIGTELVSTSGNISFHAANDILLGAVSTQGALVLISDTGGIAQTVGISAGGMSASAVQGDIVLDQNNTIGAVNTITADGSFTLNTIGDLTLEGVITAPTLVKLTAGGDITQVAASGVILSSQLQATSGGSAANGISLLGHNQVDQAALNSNGKDLRFRNTGDFALGNISAAGHIVEMLSDGGAVTQLAGTTITAGTFSATGTHVDLGNAGNQIARIGLISTVSDLTLYNGRALTIDAIDAGSHNVTINNAGDISGGNITAGLLTLNPVGGGSVALNTANHVAALGGFNGYQFEFVNDGSFTIAGAIQNGMFNTHLTSQTGSISMAGGAVNSGGITLQAASGISITGNLGYVYGAATASGDVSILSTLLDLQGDISGDTVTLGGTANGGYVRQISGSITANLLNIDSFGNADLNGATNHIAALGTLSSTVGHIDIASLDAVDLTGNVDTTDTFTLNAGGAVDQTGGRIRTTWLNVTGAGDVTLGAANLVDSGGDVHLTGDDITFVNTGTFTVAGIDAGSTGAIDLSSTGGNIWQSGAMNGGSLTASAHGSLSLNQGNAIEYVGQLSAGTELTYAGNGFYRLTGDITGTDVTLNGNDNIWQTGGSITAETLNVSAWNIDFRQANHVDRVGTITAIDSFLFRNAGNIEIWGSINAASQLALISNTGTITQPGNAFTANTLTVDAAGSIDLQNGTFNGINSVTSNSGDITLRTASNILSANYISAANGTVNLDVGGITADTVTANLLNVTSTGDVEMLGDNTLARLGNISGNNISLAVGETDITGTIAAANSIAFIRAASATDFALRNTQTGLLQAQMISLSNAGSAGTATLDNIITPSGTLELNLNFNGNATVSALGSALSLNNLRVDGDLFVRGGSGIGTTGAGADISGTLSATALSGDIDLLFGSGTVGHFGAILATAGDIHLGAAAVDITGGIQAANRLVELGADSGSVTQGANSFIIADRVEGSAANDFNIGGANQISFLGAITATSGDIVAATDRSLTIDADVTTDRSNSITLISTLAFGPAIQNSANGVLHTGTLNIQAIGDVVLTNQDILRLGFIDPTLFSFSQAADYDITTDIIADAVELTSTAGMITQSGGVITAATATLSAQNGITLLGNNAIGSLSLSTASGDIDIVNVGDLVLTSLSSPGNARVTVTGGGLTIGGASLTTVGNLSLLADNNISVAPAIDAGGDVEVTSQFGTVTLSTVRAGDDIAVGALGAVSITGASILAGGADGEGDGHNMVFGGEGVTFGAGTPAGIAAANALAFNGETGSVTINAGTGGATVNLDSMDQAISILSLGAIRAQVESGDLLLDTVSGGNVSLRSVLGSVDASSVSVTGDYTLRSFTGFGVGALSPCGCGIGNLTITQDTGNLVLPSSIAANGNILITVSGGSLDADPNVQLGADGDVEIHAAGIGIGGLSGNNVALFAGSGAIDVRDFVIVGNDYTLDGAGFSATALSPLAIPGTQTGIWTITGSGSLPLGGLNLTYNGDIDITTVGTLDDGSVTSNLGSITIHAGAIDLQDLQAAGSIDANATAGALQVFHAGATSGSAMLRASSSVTVGGSVEAGTDIGVSAQFGAATVGYASAGRDISVYSLFGNAVLRQATLTGATGDLNVQSVLGSAVLGADDYASIGNDNFFERAANSIGTANVVGSTNAIVNLDHSAALSLIQANSAEVNVVDGDLRIDLIRAFTGDVSAYLDNGSLSVGSALGDTVDFQALGGDLTLSGGSITANDLFLTSDGLIDTSAVTTLTAGNALNMAGGTIRSASLSAGGDVQLVTDTGGITIDTLTAAGYAAVLAEGDLDIDTIDVLGGGFITYGAATVRAVSAADGFGIQADGNVTLGANAGIAPTVSNSVSTGGTLAGCGCASTGGTIISWGGDVTINLYDLTGVFDVVASDTGNVDVRVASGDLGIYTLAGHDITASAAGVLTLIDPVSSGGDYALTAADFAGNALDPTFGLSGATSLANITLTDTAGNFNHGGIDLAVDGTISISAQQGTLNIGNLQAGNAINLSAASDLSLASARLTGTGTNALSLSAGGDLVFGAADAASIAAGNVFTHAAPVLTGTGIQAGGNIAVNLEQADGLGAIDGGTVQVAVRTGSLAIGTVDAVGAISIAGPSGTLTLGDVTTSAGFIDIAGQGDVTLGDVYGNFVVNLGASAGSLRFGALHGGDVSLAVAGGVLGGSVSAGTLDVVSVNGNVDLDNGGSGSRVASLGAVNVANGDFILRNLQALALAGVIEIGGALDLQVDGALSQASGYIVADRLRGSATGAAALGGDNRIDLLGAFSSNGLRLNTITALTIDGAVDALGGTAVIASHGGLTIGATGSVAASDAGDAITLASDGRFNNLAGAGALSTPNGRWLVYTQTGGNPGLSDPNNDFGGLAGTSYYGDAYDFGMGSFASAPNAGNRFVYGYRPVLTVTPDSFHVTYDGNVPMLTATVTGLVHGDSAAGAWSGAAGFTGAGSDAGTYTVYSALGSLASEMNYAFAFGAGTVTIDPRAITATLIAHGRTYDGTLGATGTLGLSGVVSGDNVTANALTMLFDNRNVGTRTVTAGGITLSGASAGNYTVNATATDLADIIARAITATLTANDRTYDGTTNASGSLALSGVLGNDQVNVTGSAFAFDSRNAGTRTATASGITLTGADAGNYTVNLSATDLTAIAARAITATLTADSRTYDGTTAATGALALNGVLGTDQVSATGSLAFDSRNAGTGRTVTASGITLSGTDAGNYVVAPTATALADILARAITATLTANDRTYDGTTGATGTLSLNGLVAGDSVAAGAGSMAFDNRNAGIGRTVTASGITLSGADAGNYTVNASATDLADILARAITASLAANGRVYDGTTVATGSLSLNGVLSGDQVSVAAGGIAFDSRNAGSRTATATGLTLGGTDAGNYTIGGTATGTATITPRAITATATADNRTYDGTTAATGHIALSGVISGDTVTGTASYRFADANAGSGRTVQVSGLALSGVEAGNYTVSLSATPVTADIARRAVTVTATDTTKIFGQPDPVFGYTVTSGSVVSGDGFTGALGRVAGDQAGRYAILQGTLALSANYLLTVVPGTLVISFTQSGAEASDALKMLRSNVGISFSVNQDPSRNLEGDGGQGADGDGAK